MKKNVAIVGGGTAGLFLAAFLDHKIYDVTIYEKNSSLGRKFLVAGDGGFNLTNSEELSAFKTRYTPASFFDEVLDCFSNAELRSWLLKLGIPTFIGSSGKIFPEKGIKPIEVLKSIERYLIDKNVTFEFNKTFSNWDGENGLEFNSKDIVKSDYVVFALGGASWKVTGSDGRWIDVFKGKGIKTLPFRASNCAFKVIWPEKFIEKNEGRPLKNIAIRIDSKIQKGEAVITKFGLEGNAIYGLSYEIQETLASGNEAIVYLDFKSVYDLTMLIQKLNASKLNLSRTLREVVKIPPVVIDLLKETLTKEEFLDVPSLAKFIKSFPLRIVASASIDEAISTTGGVHPEAIDSNFELRRLRSQFCIGEMLDWDAPTGGYLIQACASSGVYLARYLNTK